MNDWIKIKNYYITHDISLKDLAKKYGVSEGTLRTHCYQEKWTDLKKEKRNEIETKSQQKIVEKEIERKVAKNEKHIELYDNGIEIVEKILQSYREKGKVSPEKLEKLFSCIEKAQKGQRLALNMEKEDITDTEPKFVMVENLDLNRL